MLEGQCNCGAVRFALDCEVRSVFKCHCSICRRWTGSSGVAVVVVPTADFGWIRGEDQVATWTKPDADWQSCFCKTCGSALPGANDSKRMFVPVGLLEHSANLRVAHHIWVDSKAHWDVIGDDGKQHPRGFGSA